MTRLRMALVAVVAAAAPLAGVALPAATAGAATTVCGFTCQDVWGPLLGPDFILNATNLGAISPGALQGRKLNLRPGDDSATNEDFKVRKVADLDQLCPQSGGTGQVPGTGYACLSLLPFSPHAPVFQIQFAPNSVESHFCAGAIAPTNNFKVRLERCGTRLTFWVQDDLDAVERGGPSQAGPAISSGVFVPLIFAADRQSSNPLVATVLRFPAAGSPVHGIVIRRLDRTASGDPVAAQLAHEPPTNGPF